MIQVGVAANHTINVYSREPLGANVLTIINKEQGTDIAAPINTISYSNGLVTIDFDYKTNEAGQYYVVFVSGGFEMFKSMVFATEQTTKTPYQNITENNQIQ